MIEIEPNDLRFIESIVLPDNVRKGSGNNDGHRSPFSNRGEIAFRAIFTDGTSGVFVSNAVAVPEPTSISILSAGLLVILSLVSRVADRSAGRTLEFETRHDHGVIGDYQTVLRQCLAFLRRPVRSCTFTSFRWTTLAVLVLLSVARVSANESVWNNTISGNWHNPNNWVGDVPNGTDATAIFGRDMPAASATVTLDQAATIGDLTIENQHLTRIVGQPLFFDKPAIENSTRLTLQRDAKNITIEAEIPVGR